LIFVDKARSTDSFTTVELYSPQLMNRCFIVLNNQQTYEEGRIGFVSKTAQGYFPHRLLENPQIK